MHRRQLLKAGVAAGAIGLVPRLAAADVEFSPVPKGWRTFELTTRLEPTFADKAWIPLPTFKGDDWQRPGNVTWTGNARVVERALDPKYGAEMLRVEWATDQQNPAIEVTTQVQAQNRSLKPGQGAAQPLSADERKFNLSATDLLPVDGLVKETADKIVSGKAKDVDKARALYEWVVENTFRNPKTKGCGVGDVSWMLKTGNLNGKCADLNALYVAMARSVGLPARDVYGIRVVPSQFGYKSLGAGSAPKCGSKAAAGRRSTPPTYARSCSRSRRPISRSVTSRFWPPARLCSVPGKATGSPST
jgi:transglutaminase-like putative cysteine protease